jgi:hypothetical protein
MTDFTKDVPESGDLVRQQSWPCDGPAELELAVDVGRIRVDLVEGGSEVRAEVRHDPTAGGMIGQGVSGLMSWLGASGIGPGVDPDQLAREAVRAAEISWSDAGRRLVVRSPQELPLRAVPLAVTVTAPARSRITARTGSGDVTVSGTAGWTAVRTGSGQVTTGAVEGDADVKTGSGDVEVGAVAGRGRLRTGSGAVRVAAVSGPTEVRASSGDVHVREAAADLSVRTGSGGVTVSDVRAGNLDLTTGSGDLWIGVHTGVAAELDLSSGSGKARSDLAVGDVPPAHTVPVRVKGRTGSGDVLVTGAAPVPA